MIFPTRRRRDNNGDRIKTSIPIGYRNADESMNETSPRRSIPPPCASPKSKRAVTTVFVILTVTATMYIAFGESVARSLGQLTSASVDKPPLTDSTPYNPYRPESNSFSCDLLPLKGGHNVWHEETGGESIRLHQHSPTICGPKVLIVGAMKCGTNTIGHLLAKHPRVKVNMCPIARSVNGIETGCNDGAFQGRAGEIWEGNDMSIHRIQNPTEWMEHWTHRLPWTDGIHNITLDKSPSYLNVFEFPNLPQDVHELLPNAKIVVSVCDPSLRLYSEYNHNMDQRQEGFLDFYRNKGSVPEPRDFATFVDLLLADHEAPICQELPAFCERNRIFFLNKGEYSRQLHGWYDAFGEDNVMVVDMYDNQKEIATKLLNLVGHEILPPSEYPWDQVSETQQEVDFQSAAANYTGRASVYLEFPSHVVQLEQYYSKYNVELADLIGRDFPLGWNQRLQDAFQNAKRSTRNFSKKTN